MERRDGFSISDTYLKEALMNLLHGIPAYTFKSHYGPELVGHFGINDRVALLKQANIEISEHVRKWKEIYGFFKPIEGGHDRFCIEITLSKCDDLIMSFSTEFVILMTRILK